MGLPSLTLRDDFEDNLIANAWTAVVAGSATVTEAAGRATCTLPSSTAGTHSAYYRSASSFDFTGGGVNDGAYINIQTMVATGVAATMTFDAFLDGTNILRWRQLSNTITARSVIAGVDTQLFTATWSATTYKYLRIREAGGSILWESSTNGTSWTNRATLANPFPVTDLFIQFGASCGNIASPGSLKIEDFNIILPALSTNWRWTQIVWPLEERFKVVTLAVDAQGTAQAYIAFADSVDVNDDPVSPTYWSGPADGGRELTSQATQAAAQALAVDIPVDGRLDLPTQVEGKVIRVYHRSIDGAAYTLREVYPRRLIQADDIEAESIRALHIAAGSITADKLNALLIIGNTISTAYNGARVTLSGAANGGFIGYSATDTYDPVAGTGTYQVLWKLTDGKFYAGAGAVIIDNSGISITEGTNDPNKVKWYSGATLLADINVTKDTGTSDNTIFITAESVASYDSTVQVLAIAPSGKTGGIIISATAQGTGTASKIVLANATGVNTCTITGDTTVSGGLNTLLVDSATATVTDLAVFGHDSTGTPAAGFGGNLRLNLETTTTSNTVAGLFQVTWATATHASRAARLGIYAYDTVAREGMRIEASGAAAMIAFLGAAAVVRQVSGANLTNNVTAGGTNDTITNWTSLATYSTDAAAIRNAVYQLARKVKQVNDALRLYGLLT